MPGITETLNKSPVYFLCVCKSDDDHSLLIYFFLFSYKNISSADAVVLFLFLPEKNFM